CLGEGLRETIPFGRADAVHVVDVTRLVGRKLDELAQTEYRIPRSGLAPLLRPMLEPAQEDPQRCRLDRVEPGVVADQLEVLLRARAVEAQHPHSFAERCVVGSDQAAVTEAEEILRREEAERGRDARRDAGRAEGLRSVLE